MASICARECGVPVLTPEQALQREPEDLFIEDGTEVTVSVDHREYYRHFARVKAKSIKDLQTLGLVPRGVDEEQLRRAIAKDDAAALQSARDMLSGSACVHCHCADHADQGSLPYRDQVARSYSSARRAFNPALAELLSEHQETEFRWDSVHVQSVRGWISRSSRLASEGLLIAGLFQDIRIGRGARLVLDPTCTNLYARGIFIHQTGTLVHKGSYLRIWASSVERYVDWSSIVVNQHVPWALS